MSALPRSHGGGAPILLDGAMATELALRGYELREPLFGAGALLDDPALTEAVHWDYLLAGAQVLTCNSFGLHVATLAAAGLAARQAELAARSVEILEQVRRRAFELDRSLARFRVAGSISPRPQRGRSERSAVARAEYRSYADHLAAAGVDLILLETFTELGEVRFALQGLAGFELPVWLAVVAGMPVPGSTRPDGTHLLGGEPFAALTELTSSDGAGERRVPDAVLINCTQIDAVPAALDAMIASVASPMPLGLCPHLGKRRYDGVWVDRIVEPDTFAEQIRAWMQVRPRLVLAGACCGSRPAYIEAMKDWLQPDKEAREQAFIRLAELIP
jgi:homocysteine S-methyltransferase